MKIARIARSLMLVLAVSMLFACSSEQPGDDAGEGSKAGSNEPVGGQTRVSEGDQAYVLSYDLKATIDKAKSTAWDCKCKVDESIVIDGEDYTIFGDCSKQNGKQLVRRGDAYYLIQKKLVVTKVQ